MMQSNKQRLFFIGIGGLLGLILLFFGGMSYFFIKYTGRIYPGIEISSIEVGGLTQKAAKDKIDSAITSYVQKWPVSFTAEDQSIPVPFPNSAVKYDVDSSVKNAYDIGRINLIPILLHQKVTLPLKSDLSVMDLSSQAASIAAEVNIPSIPIHLEILTNSNQKKVMAVAGQNGRSMRQTAWISAVEKSLSTISIPPQNIILDTETATLSSDQINQTVDRANTLLSKKMTLSLESDQSPQTWVLSGEDIVKLITFDQGYDKSMITEYLKGIAEVVNHAPTDAKFQFDDTTGKVKEFAPADDGVELNADGTIAAIIDGLNKLAENQPVDSVPLVVKKTPPTITLDSVNRLGIKEKLGVGISTYKHSIPARVHNVELAASRLNGILIKPGEEFSFNQAVGEVSGATGYEAAYVILDGRTQLGDGGGLCQDSTTIFRAALDSGLPITTRHGHAYRVGYYEQNAKAGLDATVYAPSTDLKFLNDTPAYILIQTVVDSPSQTLKIFFYGTSDGRKSSITDHVVWDFTPALPDVNVDDPTLPAGQVKQIDWSVGGAKAKFTYTVVRGDQTIFEKTFLTVYQPWAAVYLHGTKTN